MNNIAKYLYLFVIAMIVTYSILDTDKTILYINKVNTEIETTPTLAVSVPAIPECTTVTLVKIPIIESIKTINLSDITSSSVSSVYEYSKDIKAQIIQFAEMFMKIKIEKIDNKAADDKNKKAIRKNRNTLTVFGFNDCPACRILHRHLDRLDLSGYIYNYIDIEETDLQTYRKGKFKSLSSFPVIIIENNKGSTLLKKVGYSENGYQNLKSSLKRFSM